MKKKTPRLTTTAPRVKVLIGALIGLAVGGALTALRSTRPVVGAEWTLIDARTVEFVGQRRADPGIILAVVKNEDIARLRDDNYKWPWPLDLTGYMFQWLAACEARAIVVDVYQFDRGVGPDERETEHAPGSAEYEKELLAAQRETRDLTEAYRCSGRVVLACELSALPAEAGPKAFDLRRPEFERIITPMPPLDVSPALVRPHLNLPALRLLRAARAVGFGNAPPDVDGVLRRVAPVGQWGKRRLPSLTLAGIIVAGENVESSGSAIRVGDSQQRLSDDGSFIAAFRGAADSYARVSPADMVIAGDELIHRDAKDLSEPPSVGTAVPAAVRGKIVVFGVNASGVKDVVSAPISDQFPGPEYQATILDNLLHGDGRVEVPRIVNTVILLVLCLLFGALGGDLRRRGLFAVLLIVFLVGVWVAAYRLFASGTVIDLFTPSMGLLVTYAGVSGFRALTEGRRNKWLEGTFSQYLSPAVIESLKKDPTRLELGGRKRELTVTFSDVKGFTTISEGLESNDLVRLLNDYLSRQSECVLAEDGVIDKFIGDAVMAFFGDPIAHDDHALRACRMAVRSLDAIKETQPLAISLTGSEIANRTGIATGPVTVGNMGSNKRFNYTVMGDTVNFASRLEGANKAFGSRILLADGTYQQVKGKVLAKPLAKLVVVGKTEPVSVYELVGIAGEAPVELVRHVEAFEAAHAAVLADDLDAAERHIAAAEAARPGDGPCEWLRERIGALRRGARPRPWDGVYVLESK